MKIVFQVITSVNIEIPRDSNFYAKNTLSFIILINDFRLENFPFSET